MFENLVLIYFFVLNKPYYVIHQYEMEIIDKGTVTCEIVAQKVVMKI